MKVKEKSEKAGLKFNIQTTKIMASGPITACIENWWEKNGNSGRFYYPGLQNHWEEITAKKLKDACSLEEKLWQSLTAILKIRDIVLPKSSV